mmetsp:Transcript_95933/g.133193  ORF Transcript_95933/g.133193 Transcript_95933/m.133193 type:complete len:100 (+) Transcript_95933:114-413(+)
MMMFKSQKRKLQAILILRNCVAANISVQQNWKSKHADVALFLYVKEVVFLENLKLVTSLFHRALVLLDHLLHMVILNNTLVYLYSLLKVAKLLLFQHLV